MLSNWLCLRRRRERRQTEGGEKELEWLDWVCACARTSCCVCSRPCIDVECPILSGGVPPHLPGCSEGPPPSTHRDAATVLDSGLNLNVLTSVTSAKKSPPRVDAEIWLQFQRLFGGLRWRCADECGARCRSPRL